MLLYPEKLFQIMHTTTSRERARRERPTLQELGVVCDDGGGDDYGHQPTKSEKKVLLPTPPTDPEEEHAAAKPRN